MARLQLGYSSSSIPRLWRSSKAYPKVSNLFQYRHYPTSFPDSFNTPGKGPTPGELFARAKARANQQPRPLFQANVESLPRPSLRKYLFSPVLLLTLAALGYGGYRFYHWQRNPSRAYVMNGRHFTPFILESKDKVSPTSTIFTLLSFPPGQNSSNIDEVWRLGIWSAEIVEPDINIVRSYTPLPPKEESPAEQVRFFIRNEGDLPAYLHRTVIGTLVGLKGPHPEYRIPDELDEILFLAGGTGIAPALQVAHCLYTARDTPPERMPKLRILWANRRREDSFKGHKPAPLDGFRAMTMARVRATLDFLGGEKTPTKSEQPPQEVFTKFLSEQSLMVEEVEAMKTRYDGKVSVEYFIDEENTFITEDLLREYLSPQNTAPVQETGPPRKLVLISGPDGFVDALAGHKIFKRRKRRQGPIGGIIGRIDRRGWEVWKL